jgi:hypothetical protein
VPGLDAERMEERREQVGRRDRARAVGERLRVGGQELLGRPRRGRGGGRGSGSATDGIAFDPPLPAWKADALARVVYGRRPSWRCRCWRGAGQLGAVGARALLDVDGEDGDGAVAPLVTAFAGSRRLWTRCGWTRGRSGTSSGSRAETRPELDGAAAVLSTWPDGAYSARQPDRPADLDDRLEGTVGRIAFAGEHTERHWCRR